MSLIYKNVKTVYVECVCDICGGAMVCEEMYPTAPPKFIHRCEKCGATKKLRESYPTIKYLPIEESKNGRKSNSGR